MKKSFLLNLLLIVALCIAGYWAFFSSLGWITDHGQEMQVPDMKGKKAEEALTILKAAGFSVDIDSTYDPDQEVLVVLDQQPVAGANVKKGRTLFLVINKQSPPDVAMPNLVNLSFRSAEMVLNSNKLKLGDTLLRPDIAAGAVLEQRYNGQIVEAGQPIPQGSKIDLVVGDGIGNQRITVPDLINLTYMEAIAVLNASNIQYTVIFDPPITDTAEAIVHYQMPSVRDEAGNENNISIGEFIDIRVKQ